MVLLHISWNDASRAETFVVQASACSVRDHAKACTTNIEAYVSTIYAEEPKKWFRTAGIHDFLGSFLAFWTGLMENSVF
jgi:hypothetical protein